MLRSILFVTLALFVALVGGIGSVVGLLGSETGNAADGWTPVSTESDALYRSAAAMRRFGLPLGVNEGIGFAIARSEDGAALRRQCRYAVEGAVPPARFWTLHAASPDGVPIRDAGGRAGLHSLDLLFGADDAVSITASMQPAAGNWLPLEGNGPMLLVLTLYDTPAAGGVSLADRTLPRIRATGCDA